ncbi:MAG: hypothetical protein GX445_02590 [Elusimicrobia bacterium]|nr:hypothetical protein [Elusimicrobiota bacterium]
MKEKNEISALKATVFPVVFGVMWGLFEMVFGSYLHMINFPLRGAVMAGFGAIFMCISRSYANRIGVTLLSSAVAIAVKLFSYGGFKLGPVIGIFIEGFLMELTFSALKFNMLSVFIASFLCVLEGVPHFFITTWIMYGGSIFDVYINALNNISKLFGFKSSFYIWILALWILCHIVIWIFSALISLKLIRWLKNEIP